jgi:hypothetical protein
MGRGREKERGRVSWTKALLKAIHMIFLSAIV